MNDMKAMLKGLAAAFLAMFARGVLRKYRPAVVMVTGSVGKTSTKDAVAAALSMTRYVRASEKSYNSEFGVPLTILGAANPWTSPVKWLRVIGEALALLLLPNHYPKLLVLEVGADRPGDLRRILRIATPDAVVVTRLPDLPVHVEAYATPEAVREEEFQPAYALPPGCPLVLSADDHFALTLAKPLDAKVISFGSANFADVKIGVPEIWREEGRPVGMRTSVTLDGASYPLMVRGALGAPQLLAPAAALATACALGVAPKDALKGLEAYEPPPGRGRVLSGKGGAIVIDDTYNASPAAVEEALATLALVAAGIPGMRRIAILGDMLELGRYSQEAHEKIGTLAASRCDFLVTVGSRSRATADAARAAGMPEGSVHAFITANEAARAAVSMVEAANADGAPVIILIKGSQSIRTEKVTEALLEDPKDAKYLVRQEAQWKRR